MNCIVGYLKILITITRLLFDSFAMFNHHNYNQELIDYKSFLIAIKDERVLIIIECAV